MGISDEYKGELKPVYRAALSLGIANQLTNVLRDVGEDIEQRDRIYIPSDELARFNITEKEVSHLISSTDCFNYLKICLIVAQLHTISFQAKSQARRLLS